MSDLKIARGFTLPLDIVTEAIGIVATRGAGKSYASAVLMEETHAAGVPFVVLDPSGVYHGLRASTDGAKAGLPVYVLGGPHGDLPLDEHHGGLVADVVVESGHSFVLDLSDFTKTKMRKFVAEFLERLYDRKARSRTTLLLVVDEADEFAPQKPRGDTINSLAAMETIAKRGRARGLGIVMITQRTQALNKDVLDLIETLIAMRQLAERSRESVKGWIADKQLRDDAGVIESLQALPTGTAWVWSPLRGILEKVAIRRIKTFDSYETPKPGHEKAEPTHRAELDLAALGEQMAATAERAKQNDPAELRKQLRELQQRVARAEQRTQLLERSEPEPIEVEKVVEVPAISDGQVDELRQAVTDLFTLRDQLLSALGEIAGTASGLAEQVTAAVETRNEIRNSGARTSLTAGGPSAARRHAGRDVPLSRREPPAAPPPPVAVDTGEVTRPQQKILNALAWWEAIAVDAPTRNQVAFVAGYSHSQSRGFRDPLYALNANGLVFYPEAKRVALTDAGRPLATAPNYQPTEDDLQRMVYDLVGTKRAAMLRALVDRYGHPVSREQLAEELGYSHAQSRGFRDPLYRLHALELVEYPGSGLVAAAPVLFLDRARAA